MNQPSAVNKFAREIARATGFSEFKLKRQLIQIVDALVAAEVAEQTPKQKTAPAQQITKRSDPRERSEGYISIPFSGSRALVHAALRRSINFAATRSGNCPWRTSHVITYFIQAIADEVAAGSLVRIPGLGAFGPFFCEDSGYVYPRFVPARPFRLHVRELCDEKNAKNDALEGYRRSHHPSSRPDRSASSTPGAMEALRRHIDKQAGYNVHGEFWEGTEP
jgi:hypothetical protein